ncbi:hypothetical protein NDU88_001529 [Pleurodeles waltl]|uniref:Uncharacterized protein n=1 Tax=Pleurodeles waltl TaxID=8319 RepID=A0AAV7SZK4_PLEWA|nr:hypothetical protein NDU88_001529 [Pleurodeles waltl]
MHRGRRGNFSVMAACAGCRNINSANGKAPGTRERPGRGRHYWRRRRWLATKLMGQAPSAGPTPRGAGTCASPPRKLHRGAGASWRGPGRGWHMRTVPLSRPLPAPLYRI